MKKKFLFAGFSLILLLTSCNGTSHPISDYRKTLTYKEGFKILQLTDIHNSNVTDLTASNAYVKEEIEDADPDLIVITGDTFMDANKTIVNSTIDFIDSFNIPFAFTYGNHDLQGNYDDDYINRTLTSTKNAVFVDYDKDALYGRTNYFIDLTKDNTTVYRLYILDSNSYWQNSAFIGYDIFHEEQIKHVEDITEAYGKVPSLAFFHIPLYEFRTAYNLYKEGDTSVVGIGTNEEKCSVGYTETNAFNRMKACGIEGMFIGHDHINDTTLLYNNVVLSYGMKSTAEIYHDKIGYTTITLNSTGFSMTDVKKVITHEQKNHHCLISFSQFYCWIVSVFLRKPLLWCPDKQLF